MKKSGFTLVEIMIVVAIIGLLAAIAIPSFMKSRTEAQRNACINNLRQIDAAKEQAAITLNWTNDFVVQGDAAATSQVWEWVKGGTNNVCPAGGTYDLTSIGINPTCTLSNPRPGGLEHVLPVGE